MAPADKPVAINNGLKRNQDRLVCNTSENTIHSVEDSHRRLKSRSKSSRAILRRAGDTFQEKSTAHHNMTGVNIFQYGVDIYKFPTELARG